MAIVTSTKKILTSIHGRRLGLAADKKLVVSGRTVPVQNDSGATYGVMGTPATLNTTGTLTMAALSSSFITSSTGAAVVATIDTGTAMDTADPAFAIGDAIDWTAINTGGANAFTVTASSGHTLVGTGVVALSTSGSFRTTKTAAATYVTYRK